MRFVVLDAAVMLEAGWEPACDLLVYVDAPRSVRLARVAGAARLVGRRSRGPGAGPVAADREGRPARTWSWTTPARRRTGAAVGSVARPQPASAGTPLAMTVSGPIEGDDATWPRPGAAANRTALRPRPTRSTADAATPAIDHGRRPTPSAADGHRLARHGFDAETNSRYEEIKRGSTYITELQQMTMAQLLKAAKDDEICRRRSTPASRSRT